MRRIIVAYHVYMFGDKYKDMITEQLRLLVSSGLFKICDKLYIGVNDAAESRDVQRSNKYWFSTFCKALSTEKLEVVYYQQNREIASTLNWVKDHSKDNPDDYILFFHTKGITRQAVSVEDWRHYMEYFVIEKWKDCVSKLDQGNDCCGVLWEKETTIGDFPHFSGGMFWTTAKYVNTLNHSYLTSEIRFYQEFWIGSNPKARCYEFHNSGLNCMKSLQTTGGHYTIGYPREKYMEEPVSRTLHVICTVYERPIQLRMFIDSFLVQSSSNWVLHIIHDGNPSQGIMDVVGLYTDSRINFTFSPKRNQQFGHPNRKTMLEQLKCEKGDYVLITNDDNYYVPVFVEYMMKMTDNSTGIVYCNTVHSLMQYKVHLSIMKECGVDMGAFIVRVDIAKMVGFNGVHYSADGTYATECKRYCDNRNLESRYISKPLFVHN